MHAGQFQTIFILVYTMQRLPEDSEQIKLRFKK